MGMSDFLRRMRTDRAFRCRMLAAGKDGLDAALRAEGCSFLAADLRAQLPQIQTGIKVGQSGRSHCFACIPQARGTRGNCWFGGPER